MYDGSYYKVSRPFYAHVGGFANDEWDLKDELNSGTYYIRNIRGDGLSVYITMPFDFADVEDWGDILKSIDLFVTRPVSPYIDIDSLATPVGALDYVPLDQNFVQKLREQDFFFHIGSIDLNKVITESEIYYEFQFPPLSALAARPSLEIDQLSYDEELAQTAIVYNNRIHLGNITSKLFSEINPFITFIDSSLFGSLLLPYVSDPSYDNATLSTLDIEVLYRIKLGDGGERIVRFSPTVYKYGDGSGFRYLFKQFISYPDARAYKCEVYLMDGANGWLWKEWNLKAHPQYNYAYAESYIDRSGDTYSALRLRQEVEPSIGATAAIDAANDTIEQPNRIQVSHIGNPFVYKAQHSYSVGSDQCEIRKFGVAIDEMSTSQFGQYPVYVLTNEAIYAMLQGTSGILYSNIDKVSNDIILETSKIIGVRGGIVYFTKNGLTLLSGKESIVMDDILTTDLSAYNLAVDHQNNELYVGSNTATWLLNLNERIWYKHPDTFDIVFPDAGRYIGFKASLDQFFFIGQEDDRDRIQISFTTRPIKLSGSMYSKKISNIYLDMYGTFDGGTLPLGVYHVLITVQGSNDGSTWTTLRTYQEADPVTLTGIMLGRLNASCKYIRINGVFYPDDSSQINVSRFIFDYINKYTTRLR